MLKVMMIIIEIINIYIQFQLKNEKLLWHRLQGGWETNNKKKILKKVMMDDWWWWWWWWKIGKKKSKHFEIIDTQVWDANDISRRHVKVHHQILNWPCTFMCWEKKFNEWTLTLDADERISHLALTYYLIIIESNEYTVHQRLIISQILAKFKICNASCCANRANKGIFFLHHSANRQVFQIKHRISRSIISKSWLNFILVCCRKKDIWMPINWLDPIAKNWMIMKKNSQP